MLCSILFVLGIPFVAVSSLFINPKKQYEKDSPFFRRILYFYTWLAMRIMRVKTEVAGMEKLPSGTRFVLVGNHRSNMDPILTWWVFRSYDLAFISKQSLFKIPFFGRIVHRCCFMPIDRENPKNAIKTIESAANYLKNDAVSIAVYPEGTRNKEGKDLLPFHNSIFKIAQKARVPIVVLAVDGTEKVHERSPWKRTVVKMSVVETISAESVCSMRTAEIGERAKNGLIGSLSVEGD